MNKENIENGCHIGSMIKDYLTKSNISVESAAEKVGMSVEKFNKILEKSSTDSKTLSEISIKLKHNFMADFARLVEKEIRGC